MTNFPRSPLARTVDIPLVTHDDDLIFYNEAMGSQVVQMLLGDCLLVGITSRRREQVLPNLLTTRRVIEENRT